MIIHGGKDIRTPYKEAVTFMKELDKKGITYEKMIVEKRYCLEILQQTRAITSAIKSLENNILNKHIDHCVVDAMKKNDKQKKQKIEELQDLLRKFNN